MKPRTHLQRVLLEEGRKQSWLAEKIGIDQASLSRIVNGLHADEGTRGRIADALGRHPDELWPKNDSEAAA